MRGIHLAGLLALAASVAACDSSPVERASASCTVICSCMLPPVPSQQQECVDECVGDFINFGGDISEQCTACISGHAEQCSTLEFDCEPICEQTNPNPPPEEGDTPVPPN
jgi:hypothetical protein